MEHQSDSEEEEYNKTFITDNSILDKYQAASEVADRALEFVVAKCLNGADVATLCEEGDNFIEEELKKVYCGKKTKKLERGIAFPTCICPNEISTNFSPLKDESKEIKDGDVLSIDLGCHIDGYFGHAGTSVVVGTGKVTGEQANLIVAGQTALQAAIRTCVAGKTNEDVTKVIADVAEQFGVVPLEGAYSHKHRKHVVDEQEVIMNKVIPERKCETYEFQAGDVFGLDVYLATGEGKGRLTEHRTTVYQRALENTYMLKSQAARDFFNEVNTRFPSLPFSIRACKDITAAKIGVKHCVDHELLEGHEIHALREGEFCVSFTATVAVNSSATTILCGNKELDARYAADKKVEDAELSALLALSMDLKDQKKRAKAARKAQGAEETKE